MTGSEPRTSQEMIAPGTFRVTDADVVRCVRVMPSPIRRVETDRLQALRLQGALVIEPERDDVDDVVEHLREYVFRQFRVVLTPRLIQLRRLVIGEVSRFPELAKVLYEGGSMRALKHSLRRSRVWPITISSRSITRCWRRPASIG